jgi:hypothetical protein
MVSIIFHVLVSRTPKAPSRVPSSYRLRYAVRPSAENTTNCGGPTGTGIVPVTRSSSVSTTVMVRAARLAT